MKTSAKLLIIVVLAVAVIAAVALKQNHKKAAAGAGDSPAVAAESAAAASATAASGAPTSTQTVAAKLPKLIDLGADKCIPCKMMAPILRDLAREYEGKAAVIFIDVWKNPAPARQTGIRVIPTQILYDKHGKEVGRHEGFLDKQSIVAAFEKLGVKR